MIVNGTDSCLWQLIEIVWHPLTSVLIALSWEC